MPDQPRDLLDALRNRIADPGAYLPRRFDPDGEPTETIAFWAARAIAAGLANGSLSVTICNALCRDVEEDRDRLTADLAFVREEAKSIYDTCKQIERERDQLRYERRLLGAARLVLEETANSDVKAPSVMAGIRKRAAIVAQRIVDEIGHPITDEPALGPELRAELARVTDERDKLAATLAAIPDAARAANLTHARTERDQLRQVQRLTDGLLSDVVVTLEDWLHDTTADGTPIEHLLNRIRHGLREGPAPVPGSSRRAQEPTDAEVAAEIDRAQGYAEAVARLRDDERYTNWWTSSDAKPDGRIRHHLADYLETVGPDGIDVESGRWPAREHAVIRAAIAWRKAVDDVDADARAAEDALAGAVDALPHAGETVPAAPKLAQGGPVNLGPTRRLSPETRARLGVERPIDLVDSPDWPILPGGQR